MANLDSSGTSIVCFGDSLTFGTGADEGRSYPSLLAKKVKLPVINAGVSGDTTAMALERLQEDVLKHNPKIVIITLGGNDFLQRLPKDQTLKNMEKIIDRTQKQGAIVVWAAVKAGVFADSYAADFDRLARRKRIVLIQDVLKGIMFDARYKYDNIHPNSAGYEILAERIYKAIKSL